jgi:SAM-dependent methyltransferase
MSFWRVFESVVGQCVWFALVLFSARLVAQAPQQDAQQVRDRWNKVFTGGAQQVPQQPSALLVSAAKGVTPGMALDLGIGQGRNAVYLAANRWTVTGVDLSDVAVEQANKNAAARGVKLDAIVGDLDVYDFGKQKWDLITSFYMHGWHRRSKTDVAGRISDALKPGGLVVIEGFADPPNSLGFKGDELAKAFGRLRVLRNETVSEEADWAPGEKRPIVRFVAQKEK